MIDDVLDLDVDELIRPDRVHRRLYVDPAIFAAEQSRVFAASWCFVAHESQLVASGDYLTTVVGGRSIIVWRGPDDTVHAVLNRCTHRGTELVTTPTGCAKRFTCPYHGWTFAGDGRLTAIPFPGDHAGGGDGSLDLGRLAVARYRGFVFATLHTDPPPIDVWLGPARPALDVLIDRHPGGQLAVAPSPQRLIYRGNWKLSWDNAADGLHATFAHRSYNALGRSAQVATVLARDPGDTPMVAMAMPNGHMVVDQRPGIPSGPWSTMRPMPMTDGIVAELTEQGADGRSTLDLGTGSMLNVSLFPNLLFVGNQLMVVEPLAVDRTRLTMYLTTAPAAREEVDLLRLRADEDFVSFGTPDDLDMFERVQRGLAIPEVEWIDVGRGFTDEVDDSGVIVGPITSESAQRNYVRHYCNLMRSPAPLIARSISGKVAQASGSPSRRPCGRESPERGCSGSAVHVAGARSGVADRQAPEPPVGDGSTAGGVEDTRVQRDDIAGRHGPTQDRGPVGLRVDRRWRPELGTVLTDRRPGRGELDRSEDRAPMRALDDPQRGVGPGCVERQPEREELAVDVVVRGVLMPRAARRGARRRCQPLVFDEDDGRRVEDRPSQRRQRAAAHDVGDDVVVEPAEQVAVDHRGAGGRQPGMVLARVPTGAVDGIVQPPARRSGRARRAPRRHRLRPSPATLDLRHARCPGAKRARTNDSITPTTP